MLANHFELGKTWINMVSLMHQLSKENMTLVDAEIMIQKQMSAQREQLLGYMALQTVMATSAGSGQKPEWNRVDVRPKNNANGSEGNGQSQNVDRIENINYQGKDSFKNVHFKKNDIKMVNDAANQVGVDRKMFGEYIHEIKSDLAMKANENFTYQELLELAKELLNMTK